MEKIGEKGIKKENSWLKLYKLKKQTITNIFSNNFQTDFENEKKKYY